MIRPLAIACASGVIGVVAPITAPPAHAAAGTDGACPDNVGVTVVVDFGGLGGGVSVRCAPTGGATGLAVLDAAGVSWEGTRRFPGMVCRIAGLPSAGAEPCVNAPPANAYWSYWMAPRGGSWCYSALGPGNRTPPLGSIEGWSFARLTPGADATPPHMEPLAPVDGATPHPITPGDCGSAAPTPAPTPTTAGAATNSATTVPSATSRPTEATPTAAPAPAPSASSATEPPAATSDTTTAVERSATTVAMDTSPTTAGSAQAAVTGVVAVVPSTAVAAATDASTTPSTGAASATSAPVSSLGSVDLTRARSSGGTALPTVLGVAVLAAFGGAGVWAARRRTRS